MASADDPSPLRRSRSLDWLPPEMSELRVVLLGNSWSERASVGNFILGETVFRAEEEPNQSFTVSGQVEEKRIALIHTPDLLRCNISQKELIDHVKNCASVSDPGPHVFLLVLQPEDFTDKHKQSLCRILETFSDQSFDQSLVLISTPRQESSGFKKKYRDYPPLKDIIKKCKYRYLKRKHLKRSELLARLGQIVKENKEEHINYEAFEDTTATLPDQQSPKQKEISVLDPRLSGFKGASLTETAGLRIVLLGKSEDKQRKLGNFIIRGQAFSLQKTSPTRHCEPANGQWRGKPVTVVKTPNMFSLTAEAVRREVKNCVSLCPPGPNVLLLLVKPSEFTEENRQTLKFILSLFGPDAFKHSMVIQTHKENTDSTAVKQLIEDCGGRYHEMAHDDREILMVKIENIVHVNKGAVLSRSEESIKSKSEKMKPALNLVLCGRRGAGKSSAAEAILGQTGLHSASRSSECVQHQGEVCGRWVSLVDLPALSGKPLETVMKESLRSVSLCDPEGVHAFILVLPVGPLTDEDKGELKIIQETFGSQVNEFTMILFTTESDPKAPAVSNFLRDTQEIQGLVQSCGGRHFILNIRDQQQIPELLDVVGKMQKGEVKPKSYTTETHAHAQMEKISKLHAELEDQVTRDDEEQTPERLRIVLIGRTGAGKSSSGNTILGRKEFRAKLSLTSVTRDCQKADGEVNGRPVSVVNTPGLFDTSWSHEQVHEEMIKCINLLAPGPHVFLLVLQIGRFTHEEKGTLKLMREGFGKDAEKFTIILLTGGHLLKHEEVSIEEYMKTGCDDSFKKLISDCGGRYHLFDNRDRGNREQVSELITKIDKMVKTNGGSCFINEMLQEAETAIKKEMEKVMKEKEEEMRREREALQRKYEEEMKEMEEKMTKQEEDTKREREKELKEKEEIIKKEKEEKVREKEKREQEDRERKHQEELQRLEWEQKFKTFEKKIKLESEGKESVSRELEDMREKMKEEQESWKRRQEEWSKKRNQEEEERRQEEQMKLRKLQEKFEQEREKYEKKRKEEEEKLKDQYKEEIEEERKQREKEMEEHLREEREARVKEEEKREEEDKKKKVEEELQRLEWKQKLEELEKKIKLEKEEREISERKLEDMREKMREERESWERRQEEWSKKRNQEEEERRQEEQMKLRKLQEKFEQEREKYEKERKEEDLKKQEEEDKLKIQQREEIEKERKQKEKELKEMEENIQKEREARMKERQMREEEEKKKKGEEKLQRLEWKQKVDALKRKIKLETEEKESVYKQLEETKEKMREERASWERKQKEWWEKRNEEEEERRQEEKMKLRKLQEEFEQEIEKLEKNRREEELKKQNETEKLDSQQREEIEKERKQKEKEMEENIKKEREARMKERQKREEEDKKRKEQEELQRLEWEQKFEDLETEIKSETEKRETTERKLKETKEQLEEERENWEKKQREWWEKRFEEYEKIRTEEQTKLRKLLEEYDTEKEIERKKREKEDRIRKKQEEKEKKALKMSSNIKVENLKRIHEEEVRRKDEELNELQKASAALKEEIKDKDEKYELLKSFLFLSEEELKKKHRTELNNALKRVTKNRLNMQKINQLLEKQEQEMTKEESEEEKQKLREIHDKELNGLLDELTDEEDSSSRCVIS